MRVQPPGMCTLCTVAWRVYASAHACIFFVFGAALPMDSRLVMGAGKMRYSVAGVDLRGSA